MVFDVSDTDKLVFEFQVVHFMDVLHASTRKAARARFVPHSDEKTV